MADPQSGNEPIGGHPESVDPPWFQELVRRAGFSSASGIQPGANGPAVPIHDLRRLEVLGTWSLLPFALAVWLGRPLREPSREGRA